MKVLHLTLKKKWFDMIASGEKKEEYRENKPYWTKRLENKEYTHVLFRHGYSKNAPQIFCELEDIVFRDGKKEWGAESGKAYYVIKLGEIIKDEVKEEVK